MTDQPKPQKVKLANLYQKTSRDGKPYWTGTLGSNNIVMYLNSFAQSDQDASHVIYIVEKPKTQQFQNKGYQNNQPQQRSPRPQQPPLQNFAPRSQPVAPSNQTPPPDLWDDSGDPEF